MRLYHGVLAVALVLSSSFRAEGTPPDEPINLLDRIEAARKLAESESVKLVHGTVGTRRVRIRRNKYKTVPITGIVAREMAIVVMDGRGRLSVARAIKRDGALDLLTPGFVFSVRRDNGFNSDIAVLKPAGGKVLAVRYPISNESQRFGPGDSVIEATYTPYSPEIATQDVVEEGILVQRAFIEKALAELSRRKVYSHAFPGRPVASVIPIDVLMILLINEHIDPGSFSSPAFAPRLVNSVLTIVGTNRNRAYAYSISPAGARGLVQMIPSTYRILQNKYPEARLNPNFAVGMADPLNAVIAQILLCDADWQTIRRRQDISAERIGPFLAAAYNGGVGRVIDILANDAAGWMHAPDDNPQPTKVVTRKVRVRQRSKGRTQVRYVTKRYSTPIFRSETSKYVRQYHWIRAYLEDRGVDGFGSAKRRK